MKNKGIFLKHKKTFILIFIFTVISIGLIAFYLLNNSNEKYDTLSDGANVTSATQVESASDSDASEINENSVQFKYYSSSAKDVYLTGTMNNWSKTDTKMKKDGNWFTVSIPLTANVEYKFVVDGNLMIDPFSLDTKGQDGNSYLDLATNGKTNFDSTIYAFSSQHFDYFSLKNEDKTKELEGIYSNLTSKRLAFMNPKLKRDKIDYYGVDYTSDNPNSWFNITVPFSTNYTSEVYDLWDCNSSHEIIHLLVSIDNQFFNEGIAQCFQNEGNINYKEQNVNLNMSNQMITYGTTNFMSDLSKSIQTPPTNYYCPASFIYYNTEVLNNDEEFAKFLNSLSFNDNIASIQNKYQAATNRSMSSVVTEWENWLMTINAGSNIYLN
jgi:hypothetical protein